MQWMGKKRKFGFDAEANLSLTGKINNSFPHRGVIKSTKIHIPTSLWFSYSLKYVFASSHLSY